MYYTYSRNSYDNDYQMTIEELSTKNNKKCKFTNTFSSSQLFGLSDINTFVLICCSDIAKRH